MHISVRGKLGPLLVPTFPAARHRAVMVEMHLCTRAVGDMPRLCPVASQQGGGGGFTKLRTIAIEILTARQRKFYEVVGSVFSRADLVVVLCGGVESARGVVKV